MAVAETRTLAPAALQAFRRNGLIDFAVLLLYLYSSSVAFLAGIQVDACVRASESG